MQDNTNQATVLVVDDTPEMLHVVTNILAGEYRVLAAKNGERALEYAIQERPDLIMLDILMPGLDGYEVCRRLKADPATHEIPIIFVTVMDQEQDETRGFALGAMDYVTKPFSPAVVQARVRTHLELKRHRDHLEKLVQERTAALESARREAEAANEAKGRFLSNISHELRTPLNSIRGMGEILMYPDLSGEERRDYLETLRESADSLLLMIEDILDFSRLQYGEEKLAQEKFSVHLLLKKLDSMLGRKAQEKNLSLAIHIDPAVPIALLGDSAKLNRTLNNLTSNAIKFTSQGKIEIRVGVADQTATGVLLRFEIQDTGIGIPTDKLDHLFDAFSQVDDSLTRIHGGLGLGLANSRYLITMLGGTIEVHSTPGEGSVFVFTARFDT